MCVEAQLTLRATRLNAAAASWPSTLTRPVSSSFIIFNHCKTTDTCNNEQRGNRICACVISIQTVPENPCTNHKDHPSCPRSDPLNRLDFLTI